jgi:hypothetical protein
MLTHEEVDAVVGELKSCLPKTSRNFVKQNIRLTPKVNQIQSIKVIRRSISNDKKID